MPGLLAADTSERKELLLSELLSAYILKDVKSLVKEENLRAFNHLVYLLAQYQGSVLSVHSLAGEIGVSSKAVNRYLDILDQTFVNFRVHSFSRNLGNELKKSVKTYLYDLGMRNAVLKDFSKISDREDKGAIYESFVFLKLKSLESPHSEVRFWRTKAGEEVDFIVLRNRKPLPMEVKAIGLSEIPKGLKRFIDRYPTTEIAYIVCESPEPSIQYRKCSIKYLTFEMLDSIRFIDEL